MKFKFFYGLKPKFTQKDASDFSSNHYECRVLLQNRKGAPVSISHHEDMDIWRVQTEFSSVFFATYAEALAYCKGRFFDLDGKAV